MGAVSDEKYLNQELKRTGDDIPEGTYPARLVSLGNFREMASAERFGGKKRLMMDCNFAIRLRGKGKDGKDGKVTACNYLCAVPVNGKAHIRSNAYKLLKALAAGDEKLLSRTGEFGEGITLKSFFNRTAVVTIEIRANEEGGEGFPNIKTIAPPMDGLPYPTEKEASETDTGEDIPF